MSWVTEIAEKQDAATRRMRVLLNWAESALEELKLDNALLWLDGQYGPGTLRDAIRSHPLFWTWWRNAWANRDRVLSDRIKVREGVMHYQLAGNATHFIYDRAEFEMFYRAIHKPETLNYLGLRLSSELVAEILKDGRKAH